MLSSDLNALKIVVYSRDYILLYVTAVKRQAIQWVKVATLTRFVTDNNEWFGITGVFVECNATQPHPSFF